MPKKKMRLSEMKDPEWVARKRQEFFALKNAVTRFEWGSAYIPEGCYTELYHIRRAIDRMDEPMREWKPL